MAEAQGGKEKNTNYLKLVTTQRMMALWNADARHQNNKWQVLGTYSRWYPMYLSHAPGLKNLSQAEYINQDAIITRIRIMSTGHTSRSSSLSRSSFFSAAGRDRRRDLLRLAAIR